jgi:hypothetical protein
MVAAAGDLDRDISVNHRLDPDDHSVRYGAELNSLTGRENSRIGRACPRSRYNALSNETSC